MAGCKLTTAICSDGGLQEIAIVERIIQLPEERGLRNLSEIGIDIIHDFCTPDKIDFVFVFSQIPFIVDQRTCCDLARAYSLRSTYGIAPYGDRLPVSVKKFESLSFMFIG